MTLGAQITGLFIGFFSFYYYTVKLVIPNVLGINKLRIKKLSQNTTEKTIIEKKVNQFLRLFNYKLQVNRVEFTDFSNLSHLYFIFGTLAGSIGLLLSLFLRLALSPKINVDNELIQIFYTTHASCMVCFFSLCISGFAYISLSFLFAKSEYNNLFFKTGKLSLGLAIFSFLMDFLILILNIKYLDQSWFIKIPFSNCLVGKSEFQTITIFCFVASYLLLTLNITNVIAASKIKITNLPIFVFTLLLASILIVAVMPTFASVIIMSFYTKIGTLFSESISENESSLLINFLWVITYITFFQILLLSMGMISHIVLKISRNNKLYKQRIIFNLGFIGVLGHFYWLLNLIELYFYFEIPMLILALRILTVFVIFILLICWCFCLYKSKIPWETAVLFAAGYIFTMFLGLCFLFLLSLTNFENVLLFYYFYMYVIAFALFGGFYLCFYQIFNCYYSEFLGILHFWTFFVGSILNILPQFLMKMEMYQNISIKTNWEKFVDSLNTSSELGFSFLIVSFFLFFIIVIEALVKKRTKKPLVVDLNKFDIKKATNNLDFLIAICYFVFFILFFILSIINQIYWILIMYSLLFLALVAASMSPKVTHCFSPLKKNPQNYILVIKIVGHFCIILYNS
jgi:cytochrome c oxidase subunit 1